MKEFTLNADFGMTASDDEFSLYGIHTGDMIMFKKVDDLPPNGSIVAVSIDNGPATVVVINNLRYASYVEYGHRQEPGRFIPGYWEGERFVYDPDAEGGMVLKKPWVDGRLMMTFSKNELENEAPPLLKQRLYKFLKKNLDAE